MAETALQEKAMPHLGAPPLPPASPARPATPELTIASPASQLADAWLTALADRDASGSHRDDRDARGDDWPAARQVLTGLSAMLISILLGTPFQPRKAAAVGRALVSAHFTGTDVLGRSLRVLILRLPPLIRASSAGAGLDAASFPGGIPGGIPADLEQRVAEVTEILANGYVRALRDRTLAEQEAAMRAELDAERLISQRLRHAALHDPLTGLPNRAAAFESLADALTVPGARIGLCYVDLDGFKEINDRYGHSAGDQLLGAVSERIGRVARGHDAIAARIGGDEFIVLAPDSPGLPGMIALATGILAEVSRPVSLPAGRVRVSACVGIVERRAADTTVEAAVADADAALYRAKSRGTGALAVHGPTAR
jgi:diguanylate cyclase (GGDEF)-like protein